MALAILFWLLVWQVASLVIGQELFLPSPLAVLRALFSMVQEQVFWLSVGNSLLRIGLGFLLGLAAGVLLASFSVAFSLVDTLLRPLMLLVRSTPVASFIILALVWVNSRYLSTFISFLMVLPVIYSGTYAGLRAADKSLLEMAAVFHVGFWRRMRAIYLPALRPFLLSSCELALGMSWKSGVAAEVIGLPVGTIGERLYQAKIYLMMPELFAWTLVIILLSGLFGKLIIQGLKMAAKNLSGEGAPE
ncbi:ABC transporter permease subunit [Ruminococcaceae bacterium OttesenSCG-928-I18]|nr:ABC transporter permease subunit [Ruminococcaceae bacterium OttesenSCG-928-I18]